MIRLLVAAVVGGVLMFGWGAASHMVLGLGEMGMDSMPPQAEPAVVAALEGASLEPGVYFYPGWGGADAKNFTKEQEAAWLKKYAAGPTGLILYNKGAGKEVMMPPERLLGEFASNVVAALLVACIFTMARMSLVPMVLSSIFIGLVIPASISFSHWNWYGFPTAWLTAETLDQVAGWAISGTGMALVVGGGRRRGAPS